jgi:hypothetical protein
MELATAKRHEYATGEHHCAICETWIPSGYLCRICERRGLTPSQYVELFWEEA